MMGRAAVGLSVTAVEGEVALVASVEEAAPVVSSSMVASLFFVLMKRYAPTARLTVNKRGHKNLYRLANDSFGTSGGFEDEDVVVDDDGADED